jgi:hypothetical protein
MQLLFGQAKWCSDYSGHETTCMWYIKKLAVPKAKKWLKSIQKLLMTTHVNLNLFKQYWTSAMYYDCILSTSYNKDKLFYSTYGVIPG